MKTNIRTLFIAVIIALMTYGCGVDDDDSCKNIGPIINDVRFFTPPAFNPDPEFEFNIGDEFDIIIYATDCDLDMEILFIRECYYDNLEEEWECSDLIPFGLPKNQVDVYRGYHFAEPFIMLGPAGDYIFEFQIEDQEGHLSNIFPVTITVK